MKLNCVDFIKSFKQALPIYIGYIPLGLACGILSSQCGFSPLEVLFFSILAFAGSAQFIAASMYAANASIFSICLTCFVINLRHIMMSSALAVYLQKLSNTFLAFFAYGITDETFAINQQAFSNNETKWTPKNALLLNYISNFSWVSNNFLGAIIGENIPQNAFGLGFTLTAMFISLIIFQLKNMKYVITGLLAGILAVFLCLNIEGNIYIILSSFLASSLVFLISKYKSKI